MDTFWKIILVLSVFRLFSVIWETTSIFLTCITCSLLELWACKKWQNLAQYVPVGSTLFGNGNKCCVLNATVLINFDFLIVSAEYIFPLYMCTAPVNVNGSHSMYAEKEEYSSFLDV